MTARPWPFVAAAGAFLLAASAARTVLAERAYVRGLDAAPDEETGPEIDAPGRLEAYTEALRLDPGRPEYALRAGQVTLARSRRAGGRPDEASLAAARAFLRSAAASRPLDFRPRAELARAALAAGDSDAASRESAAALRLAPRASGALETEFSVELRIWRATGGVAHLRRALDAAATLERIGKQGFGRRLEPAFEDAGDVLAGDLLEAVAGDAALASYAADVVRRTRPELARVLDESGRR